MAQNTHDEGARARGDAESPYDDSRIHPGWADQPQASYDEAHSGGWGAPGHADTGPIRLSGGDHPDESTTSYGQDAFGQAGYVRETAVSGHGASVATDPREQGGPHETFAAPTGHSAGGHEHVPHGEAASPEAAGPRPDGAGAYGPPGYGPPSYPPPPPSSSLYAPPAYGQGSYDGPPSYGSSYGAPAYSQGGYPGQAGHQGRAGSAHQGHPGQQRHRTGLGAVLDFGFVSRATRALAPLLFWLVVAWGVINVITVIVTMASMPAFSRSGGTMFFAILTALFDALVKIALARLFLELCVNVSDMAERRSGEQR